MSFFAWFLLAVAALHVAGAVLAPVVVGKPRKPLTTQEAAVRIAVNLVFAVLFFAAAQRIH